LLVEQCLNIVGAIGAVDARLSSTLGEFEATPRGLDRQFRPDAGPRADLEGDGKTHKPQFSHFGNDRKQSPYRL
jgi:hypothetical protein